MSEAYYPFGNSPWNDPARRALLAQAAADGLTARQIARRINDELPHNTGPLTRNAIIGACMRHGIALNSPVAQRLRIDRRLDREQGVVRPPRKKRAPRVARKASWGFHGPKGVNWTGPKPKPPPPPVDDIERSPLMLSLMQLTSSTCRWPIGQPKDPGFGFCGHASGGNLYCGFHAKAAKSPAAPPRIKLPKDKNVEAA